MEWCGPVTFAHRWERLSRAAARIVPLATLVLVAVEWNGIPGQERDTRAYYDAGVAVRTGEPLYRTPPPGPHEFNGRWEYLYPPPLAAILSPVATWSYRTFDRAWLLLNLAAFWAFAAALGRIALGRWSAAGSLRWGAALFFWPGAVLSIHYGNIELVILALVALALAVPVSAGGALGLAAAVKITPGWGLLPFLARRPRSTALGLAVAGAVCFAGSAAVFGMGQLQSLVWQWTHFVMPTVAQGQFWGERLAGLMSRTRPVDYFGNLSPSFAPVQLAVMAGWDYTGGPLPFVVRTYLTSVAFAAPVAAAWLTRSWSLRFQSAVVVTAAMLAAPIVRPYALASLLIVFASRRGEEQAFELSRSRELGAPGSEACEHNPSPRFRGDESTSRIGAL